MSRQNALEVEVEVAYFVTDHVRKYIIIGLTKLWANMKTRLRICRIYTWTYPYPFNLISYLRVHFFRYL